jgi:hypothetical protein
MTPAGDINRAISSLFGAAKLMSLRQRIRLRAAGHLGRRV